MRSGAGNLPWLRGDGVGELIWPVGAVVPLGLAAEWGYANGLGLVPCVILGLMEAFLFKALGDRAGRR